MSTAPQQPQLPAAWQTEHLRIRDSVPEDAPRLTAIFNACAYVGVWDETFQIVPESEVAGLVANSQSMDGEHARFRLQAITVQQTGELVGYFHLYQGVRQDPGAVGISMFVIHPDHHGQRYGDEVAQGLWRQLHSLGYRTVRLQVYLKNWPALRFWISQGFTTILRYEGAARLTPESYASLILAKELAT